MTNIIIHHAVGVMFAIFIAQGVVGIGFLVVASATFQVIVAYRGAAPLAPDVRAGQSCFSKS